MHAGVAQLVDGAGLKEPVPEPIRGRWRTAGRLVAFGGSNPPPRALRGHQEHGSGRLKLALAPRLHAVPGSRARSPRSRKEALASLVREGPPPYRPLGSSPRVCGGGARHSLARPCQADGRLGTPGPSRWAVVVVTGRCSGSTINALTAT